VVEDKLGAPPRQETNAIVSESGIFTSSFRIFLNEEARKLVSLAEVHVCELWHRILEEVLQ